MGWDWSSTTALQWSDDTSPTGKYTVGSDWTNSATTTYDESGADDAADDHDAANDVSNVIGEAQTIGASIKDEYRCGTTLLDVRR